MGCGCECLHGSKQLKEVSYTAVSLARMNKQMVLQLFVRIQVPRGICRLGNGRQIDKIVGLVHRFTGWQPSWHHHLRNHEVCQLQSLKSICVSG